MLPKTEPEPKIESGFRCPRPSTLTTRLPLHHDIIMISAVVTVLLASLASSVRWTSMSVTQNRAKIVGSAATSSMISAANVPAGRFFTVVTYYANISF